MRSQAGEQSLGGFMFETAVGEAGSRTQCLKTELRQLQRMARNVEHRPQEFGSKVFPITHQRFHQSQIGRPIFSKAAGSLSNGTPQDRGPPFVQWVGKREFRVNPVEAVL